MGASDLSGDHVGSLFLVFRVSGGQVSLHSLTDWSCLFSFSLTLLRRDGLATSWSLEDHGACIELAVDRKKCCYCRGDDINSGRAILCLLRKSSIAEFSRPRRAGKSQCDALSPGAHLPGTNPNFASNFLGGYRHLISFMALSLPLLTYTNGKKAAPHFRALWSQVSSNSTGSSCLL